MHLMIFCSGPPKPPPKTTPLRQISSPGGVFADRSVRGNEFVL